MPVLTSLRAPFCAVATTAVPEAAELDDAGWSRLHAIVEDALQARPPAVRRQLALFLRVLTWLPVLRYGRRFTKLDSDRRRAFLRSLQDAPVLKIRQGVWGLRTLVYMGYYGQPEIQAEIGYRVHPDGWKARPEGPNPERTEPVGVPVEMRPPPPPAPRATGEPDPEGRPPAPDGGDPSPEASP